LIRFREREFMPGKLIIDKTGHVRGNASISYNQPFPCPNGSYGSGAMNGVVMHTMVGNLPGTIATFNNPARQASSTFAIDQAGHIHQFGPVGAGWYAWAQVAGNRAWYSIEHADDGNPVNPLTDAQLDASAQLLECLSAFAGFPLQLADSVNGRGYGVHYMGGANWGGHTCPDVPGHTVRSSQRGEVIRRAKTIRAGVSPPPPVPLGPLMRLADGELSLRSAAGRYGRSVAHVLFLTALHRKAAFSSGQAGYIVAGQWDKPMPFHMVYWA
jgi:hypothetical protein